MTTYCITLLITRVDGEDETRTVHQEGWSANDAIRKAEQRVWEDEDAEDVRAIDVR